MYLVVVLLICLGVAFGSLEVYDVYKNLFGEEGIELYADNLPNYFQMLQARDCREFLEDERKFKGYGFSILTPEGARECEKMAREHGESGADSDEEAGA